MPLRLPHTLTTLVCDAQVLATSLADTRRQVEQLEREARADLHEILVAW